MYHFLVIVSLVLSLVPEQVLSFALHPVILIPGLEGCQLKARLNKTSSPHFWCSKHSDWFTIWLNPALLTPRAIDCFLDNMRLEFDYKTNTTRSPPGVEIAVPGFGETFQVEFLTPYKADLFGLFHELVEELTLMGYQRGKDVRGAPYDFRKAPYENQEYFARLKALIEDTYHSNHGRRCILICHSYGCINTLYFLQQQSELWKDVFIRSWFTLAAPFGGAVEALQALASGNNIRLFVYEEKKFRPMERSYSSLTFLLPDERIWGNRSILIHNKTEYRAGDMIKILSMFKDDSGVIMWSKSRGSIKNYDHPGVEVHCLRGSFVSTPHLLRYEDPKSFPDEPILDYGFGDGTVPDLSGDACLKWASSSKLTKHPKIFASRTFPFTSHIDMVRSESVISYIVGKILGYNEVNFMR